MRNFQNLLLLVFAMVFVNSCRVRLEPIQVFSFKEQLQQLFPEADIVAIQTDSIFEYSYKITLNQPFDEEDFELGYFKQEVYLQHFDEEKPVVLIDRNPKDDLKISEISQLLNANQISVINRFSIDNIPNAFNTVQLASKDVHKIISELRKIYTGKWISVGANKNGLFTLNHRATYPWDVEVSIVKNPGLGNLEPKVSEFLENNGKKIVYLTDNDQGKLLKIKPHVDVLKIHSEELNFISNLNENDYNTLVEKLKKWLGYQVEINN